MTHPDLRTRPSRAALVLGLLLTAACGRVVGAECIDGYELCGETCCPTGLCSPDGVCVADGGVADAGERPDGGDDLDGAILLDGLVLDMGAPECGIGTSRCGDECVDLDFDDDNCGGCGITCASDELCAFGSCEGSCELPSIECDGRCVDPNSDPLNCGGCGSVCESAICRPAGCLESSASDVILIGHGFTEGSVAAETMTGNAALLRLEEPVRIVVYDGSVPAANRGRILGAIETIADEAGRSYEIVLANDSQVPTRLRRADTLLLMPQADGTDEALRALGRSWRRALDDFLSRGGAIVVMDGIGDHSGTWQVLDEADLLNVDGRVPVMDDEVCDNVTPTDALANEVPISYSAPRGTVAFTGVVDGEVVEAEADGEELPVAIHRFIEP